MPSRRRLRSRVILIALLLQLHAALAFAVPCVSCLPGELAIAATTSTTMPSCHQLTDDFAGSQDAIDQSDIRCSHCAAGHCGAVAGLTLPSGRVETGVAERSVFSVARSPGLSSGSIAPLLRPPIV